MGDKQSPWPQRFGKLTLISFASRISFNRTRMLMLRENLNRSQVSASLSPSHKMHDLEGVTLPHFP